MGCTVGCRHCGIGCRSGKIGHRERTRKYMCIHMMRMRLGMRMSSRRHGASLLERRHTVRHTVRYTVDSSGRMSGGCRWSTSSVHGRSGRTHHCLLSLRKGTVLAAGGVCRQLDTVDCTLLPCLISEVHAVVMKRFVEFDIGTQGIHNTK
ncbi:hypothetical protein BDF14DRAFT_1819432 [Spinellus fusiger]|nr:hypothetical protein BDF14DRAFT_1819432 [Spinellus fusiger]